MRLRQIGKAVMYVSTTAGLVLIAYSGVLWLQTALSDGLQMMEAANIGGALLLAGLTLALFVVVENPSGKTMAEQIFGSEE